MLHIDDSVRALGPTAPDDIAEPEVPVNKSSAVQLGSGCAAGLCQTDEVLQAASKLVRIRQLAKKCTSALFTFPSSFASYLPTLPGDINANITE